MQDLAAIANMMFKMKGPSMIANSYPPAFPLKHQQKDMRLALALGDENSVSMPVAAAANEVICFYLLLQRFKYYTDSQHVRLTSALLLAGIQKSKKLGTR